MCEQNRQGPGPDEHPVMPPIDRELRTLLLDDQARQWRAGERGVVEAYFERYPELLGDPEAALDLIYNEFILREQGGERPELEEYLRRFPNLAEPLRALLHLHAAFCGDTVGTHREQVERPSVAGYEILSELGRGGMGVVYKARQAGLNRTVAVKVVLAGRYAGPDEVARFRREAEAVGRLAHPNIVQIFEVGSHD